MILIIVRHAHREKPFGHAGDNGISLKGREQARRVRKFFEERFSKTEREEANLVSSPKRRCIETLRPIARKHHREIGSSPLLDEGERLEARARRFLSEWIESAAPLTVICSHGDWIPLFCELATGTSCELSKGGWIELARESGRVGFVEIRQTL